MIDRFGKEIDDPSSVYYWCHKNNIPVFCPAITDGSIGDMLYFHSYRRGVEKSRASEKASGCRRLHGVSASPPRGVAATRLHGVSTSPPRRRRDPPPRRINVPAAASPRPASTAFPRRYKRPGFIVDIAGDIRRINDEAVRAKATGMIIVGGGLVKHHICNANLMRNGANFAVFVNTGQEFDGSDSGARPDEAVSWGKIRADAKPVKVYMDASVAFPLIVSQTFAKSP